MNKRYYIVGDIHGHSAKLKRVISMVMDDFNKNDTFIFLGDYIDRGPSSFEVIEFLTGLSNLYNAVFLTGNHEDMFKRFVLLGDNYDNYIANGGGYTIESYIKNMNEFVIPESHVVFYNSLAPYYEGGDFIAVHAGLNPDVSNLADQKRYDLIWIREKFYRFPKRWEKTVIFGHTPVQYINNSDTVYIDDDKNIIGLDTNAMTYGFPLTCLRWPDRKIYQAS